MLREVTQAIHVDAPNKSNSRRNQHIRAMYEGIGCISVYERLKEEMA